MQKVANLFSVLSFIVCIYLPFFCEAKTSAYTKSEDKIPLRILKFSPLALAEIPQPSLQIAYEYGIASNLSLQHELGWLVPLGGSSLFEAGYSNSGVKFKSELRQYVKYDAHSSSATSHYFAFEGLFKHRNVFEEKWYEMQRGAYKEFAAFNHYINQVAFHVKYGILVHIGQNEKWFADSYIGIGLRRYAHTFASIDELKQSTVDK